MRHTNKAYSAYLCLVTLRNDLQLGKEEMISALHHRTHGQVAVLADNLQKLAAALARRESLSRSTPFAACVCKGAAAACVMFSLFLPPCKLRDARKGCQWAKWTSKGPFNQL